MRKCCMCEKDLPEGRTAIPVRKMGAPDNRIWLCSKRCWNVYQSLRGR